MRRVARALGLMGALAAGCAGLEPAPRQFETRTGDLADRHARFEATAPDAPVMRIARDGDVYVVTDALLDKTFEWCVPFDDPEPRWLRFQLTEFSCQAGLIRHGEQTVDLQNGDVAVLRRNGTLAKAP